MPALHSSSSSNICVCSLIYSHLPPFPYPYSPSKASIWLLLMYTAIMAGQFVVNDHSLHFSPWSFPESPL